jgi:hypothetical protein
MDDLNSLSSLGFTLPSPTYIAGSILFGIIGFVAYRFGKKTSRGQIKWIGAALMFYPYAIANTWLLYAVGCGLCAALYLARN